MYADMSMQADLDEAAEEDRGRPDFGSGDVAGCDPAKALKPDGMRELDLSCIYAAPSARLGHLAFEGQGAFASQC
jgi:hypothetical protein